MIHNIIQTTIYYINNFLSSFSFLTILIFVVLISMFLWAKFKGIEKTNIIEIISSHLNTFKHSNEKNKLDKSELFFFLGFPLIISLLLTIKIKVSVNSVNIIITAFSIFAGLLFNLLLLLFDIVRKSKIAKETYNNLNKYNLNLTLIKETYLNIAFCICLSLIIVTFAFLFIFGIFNKIILFILSLIIYYLIIVFILTLLMVLKRFSSLLSNEISI